MAFHPYPGVIPAVFNRRGFGPPRGLTPASACPRVAHPASRLRDATRQDAILKTRFRCGSLPSLTSPRPATRWLILQKARRHTAEGAPAACGRTVSGAVSLPSRGAFHLSLAVLVRYRSQESVQPWRVVPPDSGRVPRARPYSGSRDAPGTCFAYGALTLCGRPSHAVPLHVPPPRAGRCIARNPAPRNPRAAAHARCGAVPGLGIARVRSPLLARSRLISLPPGT